jgi:hypothetical protein
MKTAIVGFGQCSKWGGGVVVAQHVSCHTHQDPAEPHRDRPIGIELTVIEVKLTVHIPQALGLNPG